MLYTQEMIDWAVGRAKRKYPTDIALICADRFANKHPGDGDAPALQFFVPATEAGYGAAMTYIVEGVGYDFFPISWERLRKIADLDDSIVFVLAEAQVVYARTPEDAEHFEQLRQLLYAHLSDKRYSYRVAEAKLREVMDIYKTMAFEENVCALRKAAGFVSTFLADILGVMNGNYTKRGEIGTNDPVPLLKRETLVPTGYVSMCEALISAEPDALPELCRKMIASVRALLAKTVPDREHVRGNPDELVGWFEESAYSWRRIDWFCRTRDASNAFYTGAYLQHELDLLAENYGVTGVDMLSAYSADDLDGYNRRAQDVMAKVRSQLEARDVPIREYASLGEFLRENG